MGKQSRRPHGQDRQRGPGGHDDDFTPVLAAYFFVQARSAYVVLQCGVRGQRRTLILTPDQAREIAEGLRALGPHALAEFPELQHTDFPPPVNVIDDDAYFAEINAWGKRVPWIIPGADLGRAAGLGVANGHVVFLQPHPDRGGEHAVIYFNPGDVDTVAGWLTNRADEADQHAVVYQVTDSIYGGTYPTTPTLADVAEIAHDLPWPPAQAETIVPGCGVPRG